jgi:uncharacterized protein YbaP (TraB family)
MPRISFACCLLAVCLVSTCTYSQQTLPKTLLWRISGKGLKQPSYLYGTMHLTDKRLFNLGDSVYRSIERTDGLAIEVNPDEMGAYYINKVIDEAEGAKLHEILSEKDFKRYSSALAKKFKKPAAEITTKDIVAEKNKWMAQYLEKGEMATFLDAYLYNIARRQGKWVGGVEDITDQTGLMEDLVDRSDIDMLLASDSSYQKHAADNMMDRMVNMYANQDLQGIEDMTSSSDPKFKDLLLIKRNVKMARRIDSLTALRTMFIAIGTAHLPGDSGVIRLLQARGFTVEPVISSKKINASDYTFKEVKLPWTESEDKQGLYKVSMPGNAINIKLFGIIDTKFLFDIFTLSNYCTMSVATPRSSANIDSVLQDLAQRVFQTKEKLIAKKVTASEIEGREYLHDVLGQKMRMQAFLHENILYVAFMNAVKKEMLTSEDADHFFKSFIITKKQLAAGTTHPFIDSVMGISLLAPAELTYNKKLSTDRDGWHVSTFAGADLSNGNYIMLISKDVVPGHIVYSHKAIQTWLMQSLQAQYTNLQVDSIQVHGCNGLKLKGAHALQKGLYMQTISLIKNNRNIVLLVIGDSAQIQTPETQSIFSSLQFIPPAAMPWKIYTTTDSLFSARVPGPFRQFHSSQNNYVYSFDTTTANSYFIRTDTVSKYTWYKNDSLFWDNTISRFTGKDSLIQKTSIVVNDQPAVELLVKDKEEATCRRMRLVPHGNQVIQVLVTGDSSFVNNSNTNEFLTSFRINAPAQNGHFFTQSKAALLLQDLTSKDSSVREEAGTALIRAEFDKQDVPLLHQALFKKYRSTYTDNEDTYNNYRIATILGKLNEAGTISFIKEKYPTLTGENEVLRNPALATLASLHIQESYTTLAQLIEQAGAPKVALDYQCIQPLKDSLALTLTIFNTLQQLAKDSVHSDAIAGLAQTLADSGFIKKEQLAPLQNDFIGAAKKILAGVKNGTVEFYRIADLMQMIGSFNTTAGNNVLRSYLAAENLYIKKEAAIQLIKNKQAIPPAALLKLAADADLRRQFYQQLKTLNKTALFPKQYATQQAFGESAVYEIGSDDDEVRKITFLAQKKAVYKGRSYTFYLYRVALEGSDKPVSYLGVAGGFKPGSTSLEPAVNLNGVYWKETFSGSKIDTQFRAFVKGMEKENDNE